MTSRRIPDAHSPNAWSMALEGRRASGARLVDITEANPTRVGLGGVGPREAEALESAARASYVPDPRGLAAAREAVAGYHASRGATLDPDDVVLTAGTSEAYAHLFRLLADPGDRVLAPRPSYPLFEPIARLEGVELDHYDLAPGERWRLDVASLEAAITDRTRAVIVVQPNHPTGSCLDAGEIAALETLCARHGMAIVSDEVFGDFGWETATGGPGSGSEGHGLPSLLGPRAVPTFVLSGLSKVCGMPQMKCSWIAACGPDAARAEALRGLEWIADLFLSVGGPVQAALPALLEARLDFQARVHARLAANRTCLAGLHGVEVLPADGGWVAMLRLPDGRSDEDWALELLRRDVIVHPGYFYDAGIESTVVVSLIVEDATFAEGLARIDAAVSEMRKR